MIRLGGALKVTAYLCFLRAPHPRAGPGLWDTPSVFSHPAGSVCTVPSDLTIPLGLLFPCRSLSLRPIITGHCCLCLLLPLVLPGQGGGPPGQGYILLILIPCGKVQRDKGKCFLNIEYLRNSLLILKVPY